MMNRADICTHDGVLLTEEQVCDKYTILRVAMGEAALSGGLVAEYEDTPDGRLYYNVRKDTAEYDTVVKVTT